MTGVINSSLPLFSQHSVKAFRLVEAGNEGEIQSFEE